MYHCSSWLKNITTRQQSFALYKIFWYYNSWLIIDTVTIIDALKSYTPHKKHRQDPEVALWFEPKSSHGQVGRKQPIIQARYLPPFHVCVNPTTQALWPSQSRYFYCQSYLHSCACHNDIIKLREVRLWCWIYVFEFWNRWVKWRKILYIDDTWHMYEIEGKFHGKEEKTPSFS